VPVARRSVKNNFPLIDVLPGGTTFVQLLLSMSLTHNSIIIMPALETRS
jgi:hypothetical protein